MLDFTCAFCLNPFYLCKQQDGFEYYVTLNNNIYTIYNGSQSTMYRNYSAKIVHYYELEEDNIVECNGKHLFISTMSGTGITIIVWIVMYISYILYTSRVYLNKDLIKNNILENSEKY